MRPTRALLIGGVIAGPLYMGIGVIEILIRPGFDMSRHELSLMSLGDLGWIQIASFLVTGLPGPNLGTAAGRSVRAGSHRGWDLRRGPDQRLSTRDAGVEHYQLAGPSPLH